MRRAIQKNKSLVLLLTVFILYSLLLIFRSSFTFQGHRYFVLFDDEMISMRYAKNLAHGQGMTWNPNGEHVEGITNPLWTIYMAGFHLLPIPENLMSLPIQLSGMIFLALTIFFSWKIIRFLAADPTTIFLTLFAIAFYFPLNVWGTILGTEVSPLVLLMTIAVYLGLNMIKKQRFSFLPFLLLGIATWVRFDMLVPSVVYFVLIWCLVEKERQKVLFVGLPILFGFVFIQEALRLWYYHDLLPNTFYLKMTGYPVFFRITRGIHALQSFMAWPLLVLPAIGYFFHKNRYVLFLTVMFYAQVLYSIYVGGDAWEFFGGSNRYISVVMPLFFVSFILTSMWGYRQLVKQFSRYRIVIRYSFFGLLAASYISMHLMSVLMPFEALAIKPHETRGGDWNQLRMARSLERITDKKAKIGIIWAGITPYFANDRTFFDLLGKSERKIAHEPMHILPGNLFQRLSAFYPGHLKWDYPYAVSQKLDMFAQIYPEDARKVIASTYPSYYDQNGFEFFVRNDTTHVSLRMLKKAKLP